MNKSLLLITLVILFSCQKKEVKIPKIALNGLEEVHNHSKIWMFYDAKNSSLSLNEKNRISTTNWLFNIDKQLLIKEVLPQAERLKIKHNEKSPHNDGGVYNYFSYVNTNNDKLSFYKFDSINYKFVAEKELERFYKKTDTILFAILNNVLDLQILKQDSLPIIQMAFLEDLSFQQYMLAKSKIENLIPKDKISKVEYIFSK